ncbi:MAG: hypothetical protein AAFV88_14135 [Planctomycetota bacterium]
MKQQETLFAMPKPARAKPRQLMHVMDAGDYRGSFSADRPDRHCARFRCRRCELETEWIRMDTVSESKRGIPCPACNKVDSMFLPLKAEYFDAFVSGHKTTEYRQNGPRFNDATCKRFRRVVLSSGYGKHNRCLGMITEFSISQEPCERDDWKACFGDLVCDVACIEINAFPGVPVP